MAELFQNDSKAKMLNRHILNPNQPSLYITKREKAVLCHLSEGKLLQTAYQTMGIVHRTAEYFLVQMQKRFDCATPEDLLKHPIIATYLKNGDR